MVAAASILDTPPSANSHARGADSATWLETWSQRGWLCLNLRAVPTGALGDWLGTSVETELARLGAVPRPDYVSSTFKPLLEDQIYRARMLGFQGLALQLPSLQAWASEGTLSPQDSSALLAWCEAARELAVPLRLCTRDASLRVYEAPIELRAVAVLEFSSGDTPASPDRPSGVRAPMESSTECVAPSSEVTLHEGALDERLLDGTFDAGAPTEEGESDVAIASAVKPIDEEPPCNVASVIEQAPAPLEPPQAAAAQTKITGFDPDASASPSGSAASRRAAMRSLLEDEDDVDAEEFDSGIVGAMPVKDVRMSHAPASPLRALKPLRITRPEIVPPAPVATLSDERELPEEPLAAPATATPSAEETLEPSGFATLPSLDSMADELVSHDDPWAPFVDAQSLAPHAAIRDAAPLGVKASALAIDDNAYSHHIEGLQATGGSHGWDEIEQLFETHYLPLQKAVRDGAAPALAAGVLADWAKDFAESYERAFEAIRSNRGKKPRLVLDVPSYAFQLSRKHNAEHLKMVLIDGMRADIGPVVRDKLRLQMANTAECVGSGLLWSALPANTAAQMELIARGSDGLRHFSGELTEAQLMSRGNDLRRLRPVRVGSHRMYKLDIVQYLAKDAERHSSDHLEQYAAEVATSVGRFLRQQEPNTLVYLFGDHGFGGATNAAPEQILTPYQAWLIGG